MSIAEALAQLDPENDEHWTSDGLPRIDVVQKVAGLKKLSRQEITDADPNFTRETAGKEAAAETEGETPEEAAAETEEQEVPIEEPVELPESGRVIDLPISTILGSQSLCEAASLELAELIAEAQQTAKEANQRVKDLAKQQDVITMVMDRRAKTDPNKQTEGIKDYLERARQAREAKAQRAKAFINAGTTPQAVAEQLNPKSKLDQSMARKVGFGHSRPTPRQV